MVEKNIKPIITIIIIIAYNIILHIEKLEWWYIYRGRRVRGWKNVPFFNFINMVTLQRVSIVSHSMIHKSQLFTVKHIL